MNPRIPFAAAVVGVLLVGGATTGGTHASWSSQRTLPAQHVQSGSMTSTGVASPAAVTVNRAASTTVDVTVTDGSEGKNLVQQVTPTVTATAGSASLVTKAAGACTTTAQPAVDLVPSGTFTTCVRYTAPATTATTATITVTLNGRQKRGGVLTGWTAPARTVTIPVTITQPVPVPAAPVITCVGANHNGFQWAAVAGAEDYSVFTSTGPAGPYTQVGADQTTRSHLPNVQGQSTTHWRVRANNASGASAFSNTLRITRNGSNYTCGTTP